MTIFYTTDLRVNLYHYIKIPIHLSGKFSLPIRYTKWPLPWGPPLPYVHCMFTYSNIYSNWN